MATTSACSSRCSEPRWSILPAMSAPAKDPLCGEVVQVNLTAKKQEVTALSCEYAK